jgi:hypothetical protein
MNNQEAKFNHDILEAAKAGKINDIERILAEVKKNNEETNNFKYFVSREFSSKDLSSEKNSSKEKNQFATVIKDTTTDMSSFLPEEITLGPTSENGGEALMAIMHNIRFEEKEDNNLPILTALLNAGINVNYKHTFKKSPDVIKSVQPLIYHCLLGVIDNQNNADMMNAMKILIDKGADINAEAEFLDNGSRSVRKMTCLDRALISDNKNLIKFLEENGAKTAKELSAYSAAGESMKTPARYVSAKTATNHRSI